MATLFGGKLQSDTLRALRWLILLAMPFAAPAFAEDGVLTDKIVFGQTAATGGPASALGEGMREGILAAFKEVNDKGGIDGRKLELITRDDGYEPDRAIANTKQLLSKDKVFALIGGVGTTTANAIQPIATAEKVPFIGPFTGAKFLRNPFNRYTVNIRASYAQETEEWIERLTKDLGVSRIAIFYQDDTYGLAGLSGVRQALEKRGMQLVGEGTYKRNTIAVKEAVLQIRESDPQAVVMVGTYKPCAEFIKLAKRLGVKAYFVNISFVGSEALAKELGAAGAGVIISQVVPSPYDVSVPLVKAYHEALKHYDPKKDSGFISMEGYMVGRLVAEVLRKTDAPVTREAFLDTLYKIGTFSLDGMLLTYGVNGNQGLNKVFLTVLDRDGHFSSVTKLDSR
jgi:branched-chain amino acid transport system substrate-binding protein